MTSFRPTKIEQFAIEAKLNRFFGAKAYDRVFLGFEVLEIVDDELHAWSPSEYCAAVIDLQYSAKVAWIAQTVFNRPVRKVSVLARGMNHKRLRTTCLNNLALISGYRPHFTSAKSAKPLMVEEQLP